MVVIDTDKVDLASIFCEQFYGEYSKLDESMDVKEYYDERFDEVWLECQKSFNYVAAIAPQETDYERGWNVFSGDAAKAREAVDFFIERVSSGEKGSLEFLLKCLEEVRS